MKDYENIDFILNTKGAGSKKNNIDKKKKDKTKEIYNSKHIRIQEAKKHPTLQNKNTSNKSNKNNKKNKKKNKTK